MVQIPLNFEIINSGTFLVVALIAILFLLMIVGAAIWFYRQKKEGPAGPLCCYFGFGYFPRREEAPAAAVDCA